MTSFLIIGFLIGLSANFHCIGMCGPLAYALPIDRSSTVKSILSVLKYNAGRIFSYSFLGMIVGLFGFSVLLFTSMQWMSIISGLLIIFMAWSSQIERWPLIKTYVKHINVLIQSIFKKTKTLPISIRSISFGIANGFLPCGLVYLGLTNALASGSLKGSIFAMAAFGVGTLPAMFFIPLISKSRWKIKVSKFLISLLLTMIGLLTMLRGMNLGIPYVSPKLQIKSSNSHIQPYLKCCEDSCFMPTHGHKKRRT